MTQIPEPPEGRPPLVPPLLVPASKPGRPPLPPPAPPVRSRQQWVFESQVESHGAPAWISDAFEMSFVKSPEKEQAGTAEPDEPPLLVVLPELDVVEPELDVVDPLLLVLPPLDVLPPAGFDGGNV